MFDENDSSPRVGSNVLGCESWDEREALQTATTVRTLAQHALNPSAGRDSLAHLAALTRPLARPLGIHEALVAIEPDHLPWDLETIDIIGEAPTTSPLYMEDGQQLVCARKSYRILKEAVVTQRGYAVSNNVMLIDSAQFTLPGWQTGQGHPWFHRNLPFEAYNPQDRTAVVDLSCNCRVAGATFLFSGENAALNFGHFIHDFLLQYPVYRAAKIKHPKLNLIFHREFKYPIQQKIFEWLLEEEITNNLVIRSGVEGIYEQLLVPAPQFGYTDTLINIDSAREVRSILRNFAATFRDRTSPTAKRIFVSRRDGTSIEYGRDEVDHDTLEASFRRLGFEVICASQMPIEDLLAYFHDSEIVAGVHGAGLMNVLFSGSKAPLLLELDSIRPGWTSIERTVRAAGLNYKRLKPTLRDGKFVYDGVEDLF